MTLAGALKDDLVALEAGPYRLLPFKDISGRSLLYWEPHLHIRKGYSSDSLRRAIWYTIEVAAQESIAVDCGIVQLLWERHTSLFDYDPKMHDAIALYLKTCWPVKMTASHICCPPRIPIKVLKPIMHFMLGKEMRTRVLIHDVPEHEIAQVLSRFGILNDMLPIHMGGTIRLDQQQWMAERRSIEIEEIE